MDLLDTPIWNKETMFDNHKRTVLVYMDCCLRTSNWSRNSPGAL